MTYRPQKPMWPVDPWISEAPSVVALDLNLDGVSNEERRYPLVKRGGRTAMSVARGSWRTLTSANSRHVFLVAPSPQWASSAL